MSDVNPTHLTYLFGLLRANFKDRENQSVVETHDSNVLGSEVASGLPKKKVELTRHDLKVKSVIKV